MPATHTQTTTTTTTAFDSAAYLSLEWVIPLEEAIARNVYSVKSWCAYLTAVDDQLLDHKGNLLLLQAREWVGQRAVYHLPRSYKLWKLQWECLVLEKNTNQIDAKTVVALMERALVTLSPCPRVWTVYLEFLFKHTVSYTHLRRTINRSLQSVAVPQHDKIWKVVLEHIDTLPFATADTLWQRHLQFDCNAKATYAEFCERNQKYGLAATVHLELLQSGQSNDWQSFCEIVAQHSAEVEAAGLDWQVLLETAIEKNLQQQQQQQQQQNQTDPSNATAQSDLSLLYAWLASAFIQTGNLDMARAAYETGLRTVVSVRDFSILYAAYLTLEESLLNRITENMPDDDDDDAVPEEDTNEGADGDDWDLLLAGTVENKNQASSSQLAEMELAIARAEHLTKRRPLLLNAVKLRQNPNDIDAWLERSQLLDPRSAKIALNTALNTAVPAKASLVQRLVGIYEQQGDLDGARTVLDKVCRQQELGRFRGLEELSECWALWIELELKHERWDDALSLARQSVAPKQKKKLHKSLRLWDLRLDLEESLGTVQTAKDAYNQALNTKVATVQQILNFTSFLKENKYFEETFSVYERGLELFAFPHPGSKLLWKSYLEGFLTRYKGTKMERTRHLFQRCLDKCPAEECAEFYLLNGDFEEQYGLTKRALSVYKEMCEKVPMDDKYTAYQLFIVKTSQYLGVSATRDVYQEALDKLKDNTSIVKICMDFAKAEVELQEMERARAIYAFGAQSADPRRLPEFWKEWNDFEIAHGNEDTFRDMLRVKRKTEASFSTINYNAQGMTDKVETFTNEEAMRMIASGEGMDLDETATKQSTAVSGFVPSKRKAASSLDDVEDRVAKLRKATGAEAQEAEAEANDGEDDNEIDLDEIDAEIEEAAAEGAAKEQTHAVQNVATKAIPDAVFGGLTTKG